MYETMRRIWTRCDVRNRLQPPILPWALKQDVTHKIIEKRSDAFRLKDRFPCAIWARTLNCSDRCRWRALFNVALGCGWRSPPSVFDFPYIPLLRSYVVALFRYCTVQLFIFYVVHYFSLCIIQQCHSDSPAKTLAPHVTKLYGTVRIAALRLLKYELGDGAWLKCPVRKSQKGRV